MTNRLYTYYPELDEEDSLLWHVYETASDQVVASFFFEEDAKECMYELENGKGFCGFTPSFILRKVFAKENINDAFLAEFSS